jgi:hypothetical protein
MSTEKLVAMNQMQERVMVMQRTNMDMILQRSKRERCRHFNLVVAAGERGKSQSGQPTR